MTVPGLGSGMDNLPTKSSPSFPRQPRASTGDISQVLRVLVANQSQYLQRDEIAALTGINERIVRSAISAIVEGELAPVVPDREHGGYKISAEADAILTEVRRLESQINNTVNRIAALKRMASDPRRATALTGLLAESAP